MNRTAAAVAVFATLAVFACGVAAAHPMTPDLSLVDDLTLPAFDPGLSSAAEPIECWAMDQDIVDIDAVPGCLPGAVDPTAALDVSSAFAGLLAVRTAS